MKGESCCGGSAGHDGPPVRVGVAAQGAAAAANSGPSGSRCACGGTHAAGVPLTTLRAGQTATVCETCMDPADAAMVRAMGLRPNSTVRLCRLGEPCIVEVLSNTVDGDAGPLCERPDCRCRIGLARDLAARVRVLAVAGGS